MTTWTKEAKRQNTETIIYDADVFYDDFYTYDGIKTENWANKTKISSTFTKPTKNITLTWANKTKN